VKNHFSKSLQRFGQSFAFLRNSDWSQLWARKQLNTVFAIRDRIFFRKKRPQSECYPYTVHDPFELFGEDHPYGDFYLVGDAWRDTDSQKPVAICWGFNDWKLVFWGYNEPWLVSLYARSTKGLQILRAEDGFLRSAELGAAHTTPYSLVFDSRGLYYNPNTASDLEEILNHHEFSDKELDDARECLQLMQELRLSKYNPPASGSASRRRIKTRRRVAVIGQVKSDRSVRMGNINRWSEVELVRLAKQENPGAEIVYRPHPDVHRGFQRNGFRRRAVEKFCTISAPDDPLPDFLDGIDHVYVITSLAGLEALLRGIKVTVVGAAFYAGWGLTDDRITLGNRHSSRSTLEIFAATYLLYSKFLGWQITTAPRACFMSAGLRIAAERKLATTSPSPEPSNVSRLPQLFSAGALEENGSISSQKTSEINFQEFLCPPLGRLYQQAFSYAVCGALPDNDARHKFLLQTRHLLSRQILNSLLVDLHEHYPGEYILTHVSWLLATTSSHSDSKDFLLEHLARDTAKRNEHSGPTESQDQSARAPHEASLTTDRPAADLERANDKRHKITLLADLASASFEAKDFYAVVFSCRQLLLLGPSTAGIALYRLAKLAEQRFDMLSAKQLGNFLFAIDPYASNRFPALLLVRSYTKQDVAWSPLHFLVDLALLSLLKPEKLQDVLMHVSKFSDCYDAKLWGTVLSRLPYLDNANSTRKSAAFLSLGDTASALAALAPLIATGATAPATWIAYSQALSYGGRTEEARKEALANLKHHPTVPSYQEALRILILCGDYESALNILNDAKARNLDIGDMYHRKVYFGSGLIREAFAAFQLMPMRKALIAYYPDKYYGPQTATTGDDSVFVLAVYGPGDEIRFASIYHDLTSLLPHSNITISCDPRLMALMQRSFPQHTFVGVPRPRDSEAIDLNRYSRVKGADIMRLLDNTGSDTLDRHAHVTLVTDLLERARPSLQAFTGSAYLQPDPALRESFFVRLPQTKMLVGISWRSSLATAGRNEHYLSIQDLEPVLSLPHIQFVNLQYDDCHGELEYIEQRMPGRLLNFKDLDQFNDLDSVAALMTCLDLVVSPATTVIELAGALGVRSLLLSNSSELWWRRVGPTKKDVWHPSVSHVESTILGDKDSLVTALVARLETISCSAIRRHEGLTHSQAMAV